MRIYPAFRLNAAGREEEQMHTAPEIQIRPVAGTDDIEALTALLHAAYAVLGDAGLNYTAVDQSPETTRKRLSGGAGFVAIDGDGRVVGTIVYHAPGIIRSTPWLERPGVAHFGQFAVAPAFQRHGSGSLLLNHVETVAQAAGAAEIALDTAETAHTLVDWYVKRGYRAVEHAQWKGKRYRSVILSKTL
jgi:GNAT superfamily N-acetyltransferase